VGEPDEWMGEPKSGFAYHGGYLPPGDTVDIQQARLRHEDTLLGMRNMTGVGLSKHGVG